MRKENELIEQKELREQMIERVEILDKVGELLLLKGTDFATQEQVSNYYNVTKQTIESIVIRNSDELLIDGFKTFSKKEIETLNIQDECFKIPNRGMRLFPKRAILRVGMLLQDSEVAKEIRTRLLDIVQDVSEGKDNVIESVINEISEEKQLMLDRVEAEMNGDWDKVCVINAKLFAIKNKRIKDLEDQIDILKTNSLSIAESRVVINKLVRLIAIKEYNGMFGKAFGDLYKQVNYKLGINLKARNKTSRQTVLDVMSEDEIKSTEIIVKCWADEVGIDVRKELNLAS
ncbi:hypothetical protein [Clostridium sp.]|uniref:hypothetical protein n=1 Tax=Clostridium sp. TaxID=1506 RepID=UPI002909054A|nr:hypothetical protein [Clostridium sp.]MDU3410083.1 hypothetical protein [Clostridium sp.]